MTETLNEQQKKAVLQTKGRLLLLAGAGSGKTRVIIHRIAYLIQQKKIAPSSILALTFTNKAAKEMQERVMKMVGAAIAKHITLSTFHSFCMQILRKEAFHLGFSPSFSLYDERDMQRMIGNILQEMHANKEISVSCFYEAISHIKNHNLSMQEFPSMGSVENDKILQKVYQQLEATLCHYNAVDFDSLLSLCVKLFEEKPQILQKYQNRFQYIMIDEYQDTNPIQDKLAHLLSQKHNNLCVVGDDDQSIYGWRGATVDNILHFSADTTIKLEQNYRSTSYIITAANHVIQNNKKRHTKNLWTKDKSTQKICLFHAPTEQEEATAIINKILILKTSSNYRWKDFAILYRSNALSRNLEMALLSATWKKDNSWLRGIPYEIIGGMDFSERSEIKDLLSFLKVIANPKDEASLLRVINVPSV